MGWLGMHHWVKRTGWELSAYLVDISRCTSYSVLAIDLLNVCLCMCIHTTWCASYTNVKASSMKKSRHNDSLSICSMKLCSCKLSTGTNEVLLCSASVSVRNVVGCWECLPFYKEKDMPRTQQLCYWECHYILTTAVNGEECLAVNSNYTVEIA